MTKQEGDQRAMYESIFNVQEMNLYLLLLEYWQIMAGIDPPEA